MDMEHNTEKRVVRTEEINDKKNVTTLLEIFILYGIFFANLLKKNYKK